MTAAAQVCTLRDEERRAGHRQAGRADEDLPSADPVRPDTGKHHRRAHSTNVDRGESEQRERRIGRAEAVAAEVQQVDQRDGVAEVEEEPGQPGPPNVDVARARTLAAPAAVRSRLHDIAPLQHIWRDPEHHHQRADEVARRPADDGPDPGRDKMPRICASPSHPRRRLSAAPGPDPAQRRSTRPTARSTRSARDTTRPWSVRSGPLQAARAQRADSRTHHGPGKPHAVAERGPVDSAPHNGFAIRAHIAPAPSTQRAPPPYAPD